MENIRLKLRNAYYYPPTPVYSVVGNYAPTDRNNQGSDSKGHIQLTAWRFTSPAVPAMASEKKLPERSLTPGQKETSRTTSGRLSSGVLSAHNRGMVTSVASKTGRLYHSGTKSATPTTTLRRMRNGDLLLTGQQTPPPWENWKRTSMNNRLVDSPPQENWTWRCMIYR